MKKILVLTVMVMLVASMSVMASDVAVSGQVQYEWAQDFDTLYDYNGDAEIVATATVDDYNTAVVDFDYAQDAGTASTSNIQLDKAYFTTAIGKYAGLEEMGVTISLIWGWQEWSDPQYAEITGYERENVFDGQVENWQFNIDIGIMDMVHIEAAMAPEPGLGASLFGVYGGMDPVWVSVYYAQEGEAIDLGDLGLGVNFGMDIVPGMYAFDIGVAFRYNLDSDAFDGDQWGLGVGITNTIMEMVYVNLGIKGNDDTILNQLWVELGADYQDMVGVDLGIGTWMHEDAPDALDEIDGSVWVAVGAAKFRVGYVTVSEDNQAAGGGDLYQGLNAPSDADHVASVAAGVFYFSGTLDF